MLPLSIKKRIGRILIPLIFWSIALPIAFFVYLNFIKSSSSALIDMNNFTAQATGIKIYTAIFNFNYDTTPLWYMYMLIGYIPHYPDNRKLAKSSQ
jgi:hypothetical protein